MTVPETRDGAAPDVSDRHPWRWVPSLYFAEGLPYVVITVVSVILYKRLGLGNAEIAFYTSWLYLPWVVKPLWSPLIDLLRTKRFWILAMQLLIGAALGGVALTIPADDFVRYTLLLFWLMAFSSATHDIAADGFYMLSLSQHQQTWFVGIRNTFYRVAMISGQGLLVMLAGYLESAPALNGNVRLAWSLTFLCAACIMLALAAYHLLRLPEPAADRPQRHTDSALWRDVVLTFTTFFRKPDIVRVLAFLLLYRFAEAQLAKIAPPFLLDSVTAGGLGLATADVGFVYGVVGVAMLVAGGLLGAALAAKDGLKHWLPWMVLAINAPNVVYIVLAYAAPVSLTAVHIAVATEQFGYGFGFTAFTLYMLYVSDGPQRTAHFAICTGFMALGMMVPGLVSGWIQELLGYRYFFIWVLAATIPSFAVARLINVDARFGRNGSETAR